MSSIADNDSQNVLNKSNQKLSSEEIAKLPEVRRRIRALKKLQFNKQEIDGQLEEEILKIIESKFRDKYDEIFTKRRDIITGSVEPTEDDCDFDTDSEESEPNIEVNDQKVEGIPRFWLDSLESITLIRQWISDEDMSALFNLKDIVLNESSDPPKLVIEFYFEPNEYFENEVLTKEYLLKFGPDPENTNDSVAFYPIERKGCAINWKKGKKLLKNYSKHRCPKLEEIPSFFCFFDPPEEPKDKIEMSDDLKDFLWEDWQIAFFLAKKLVPNAVLFYTGDMTDEESEDSSSDSDSDE